MTMRRISGVLIGAFGIALFAWLLYDASAIVSALRLSNIASESTVAVTAMIVAAACIAAALFAFFRLPLRIDSRR